MASGDLVAGRSEREVERARQDLERQRRRRAEEARNELTRLCPPGHAYDLPHALALLSDLGGGNRSRLLQRTFLVRQAIAQGWSPADVGRAFDLDPAGVEHERARSIWWRPTDDLRAHLEDEVRADLDDRLRADRERRV